MRTAFVVVTAVVSLVAGTAYVASDVTASAGERVDKGEAIQARYRHTTPYYDVVVLSSPARIESLAVDPTGQGHHIGVINNYGRMGSAPFASYGSYSNVESNAVHAGRPGQVVVGDDELRLENLPIGKRGISVDWVFAFDEETFDVSLDWHVSEPQTDLWELGWKLDGVARAIGDEKAANLPIADRGPFVDKDNAYLAWSESDPRYAHTLVTAFVPGSADRGDQVHVEPNAGRPVTWGLWATVSANGGTELQPGTIRGGRWRIGASGEADDREYAAALAAEAAGGPAADPAPGPDPYASDRDDAVAFGKRLDAAKVGEPQVADGPEGSVLLSDGSVLAAFVPDGDTYRSRMYVAVDDRWQLAATGGPSRRFTRVDAVGDDALRVAAEGIGPDGSGQTTTNERWTIRPGVRNQQSAIHVTSTDSPASGHTAHPMHTYLAYPGASTKHEIDDYDVVSSPLLRPQADLIVGQRALWSPALQVQEGVSSVALIPDLLDHREPGAYAQMPAPRYFGPSVDLDLANRFVDAPVLGFGWRTTQGVYGYYYRDVGETPAHDVTLSYDLVLRAGAEEFSVTSDVQERMWERVGKRYFEQSRLPQTQPADNAFDEAWSHWADMYDSRVVDGELRGAVRIDRAFAPDANFMSWFNALRSSYGLYTQGKERRDHDLVAKGRATLDLLLSAPQERGAFPTIVGFRGTGPEDSFEWYASHQNFLKQMPWGPTSYNTFDMGWAAYWVLRWHQDLLAGDDAQPRALEFARSYGDFLLEHQLPNGAVPSWFAEGSFEIDPHLRESAQTSSSVMFLAELAKVTGEKKYVTAAEDAAVYVSEHHVRQQRWDDFEPYYSNSLKSEGAADPFSGQSAQNTLSMHFAALGYLTLYELTGKDKWLADGERTVDTFLQYQYVTPGLGLSLNSFGGFAVQNTDNEAVDARQSQFGVTLLDYARATGRADYAQRGIAAIRAGYATMASPSAEILNPKYFDAYPVGRGPENYAHATYDTPAGYTVFDWGQGSAGAGFAEAHNRFGDVWIDGRHGTAYGIDNVHVEDVTIRGATISITLTSPSPDHEVTLKADGLRSDKVRLRVNGGEQRLLDRAELARGIEVPTRQSVRIVHNPDRSDLAVVGEPFTVDARITHAGQLDHATLHYRVPPTAPLHADASGEWVTAAMSRTGSDPEGNRWSGTIPGDVVRDGHRLEYYITAATGSDTGQAPEVDPAQVPFVQHPTKAHIVETDAYRAVVGTGDQPGILSFAVDPDGDGTFRQVMHDSFRGTVPYAAVGNFGDTDRPGAPANIEISDDGRQVTFSGIPIGDEPITADWTLRFNDTTFDHAIDWHLSGPTSARVWELGWNWDTSLATLGDPDNLQRGVVDARGFSPWTMAHDDSTSLVAAYLDGSAWLSDNRWFNPPGGNVAWQSVWQPGGRQIAPGDYAGGTWRIGASANPADTEFADQLHAQLNGQPAGEGS